MRVFIIITFLAVAASAAEETSNGKKARAFPSGLLYKSKMGSSATPHFRQGGRQDVAPLFRRGRPEDHLLGRSNLRWVSVFTMDLWLYQTTQVQPAALGQSSRFCVYFFQKFLLQFLSCLGCRVAVVSAHQPVELPGKLLTEPWDGPNAAGCSWIVQKTGQCDLPEFFWLQEPPQCQDWILWGRRRGAAAWRGADPSQYSGRILQGRMLLGLQRGRVWNVVLNTISKLSRINFKMK